MSKSRLPSISDYDIRVRAHRIWEKSGRPEGRSEEHWREALAELEAERAAACGVPAQPRLSAAPVRIAQPADHDDPAKDEAA
jgi:hypothetical protein